MTRWQQLQAELPELNKQAARGEARARSAPTWRRRGTSTWRTRIELSARQHRFVARHWCPPWRSHIIMPISGNRSPRMRRLAAVVLLLAASHAFAFTADELAAKNVAAKGGIDRLNAIHSLRLSGKLRVNGDTIELDYRHAAAASRFDPLRGRAAGSDSDPGVRWHAGLADQPVSGSQGPGEAVGGRRQGARRGRGGLHRRAGRLQGQGLHARLSRHRGRRRHAGPQAARHAAERRHHLRVSRSRLLSRDPHGQPAHRARRAQGDRDRLRRLREGRRRVPALGARVVAERLERQGEGAVRQGGSQRVDQ